MKLYLVVMSSSDTYYLRQRRKVSYQQVLRIRTGNEEVEGLFGRLKILLCSYQREEGESLFISQKKYIKNLFSLSYIPS